MVIFSKNIAQYRPVIWYGEPIYLRSKQLRAILKEKLGDKYAELLSEPIIDKSALRGEKPAHWTSEYVKKGKPISKLSTSKQKAISQELHSIIQTIQQFAENLQTNSDADLKQLGELLFLAIEVPSLDYVFVEDEKITLVLWGFAPEENQKPFKLKNALSIFSPNTEVKPPVTNNENKEVSTENNQTENTQETQNQQEENNNINTQSTENKEEIPPENNNNNNQNKDEEKKKHPLLWMFLGALIMLILLLLFYFFFLKNYNPNIPEHGGNIPPVDTTQNGIDPNDPAKRIIQTNKLNIALIKNANAVSFMKEIDNLYSSDLKIVYCDTVINLLQVQTPKGQWKQWKDSLKKFSDVRIVFNESLFRHSKIPNDPGFKDKQQKWYFEPIKAYKAWGISQGSENVTVAVLDNGFDKNHIEFKNKIVNAWNVVKHSFEIEVIAKKGSEHGTHVAATAVGFANNNAGVAGIAPNCKLMPIQVCDANGNMSSLMIVAGILYAIHKEADIINMSLGMQFSPEIVKLSPNKQKELTTKLYLEEALFWDDLFKFAIENNIVIVQAAGNQNVLTGIDPMSRSKNSLIVAATMPENKKAIFSNYGKQTNISAPGVEIYSAAPNNEFKFLQGTSMASPIVAGGAALLKSVNPKLSPYQIIETIHSTGLDISKNSAQYIAPLIQLDKALEVCKKLKPNNPDCEDLRDSLRKEVERLKKEIGEEEMIIPENPEDLKFATGRWKSTQDLTNTAGDAVSLYFDIQEDGKGKLTLIEKDGNECVADLKIWYKDGALNLIQENTAKCKSGKEYRLHEFVCKKGSGNRAECIGKDKTAAATIIRFSLKKEE